MAAPSLYPVSTKDNLRKSFVRRSILDVATPAAIIDLSKVKRNCTHMLETVETLGFGWRAHIKTHKTTELTRLQVGDDISNDVNVVVSTVIEAENVVPLLLEYKSAGRKVNLLYGLPVALSSSKRLAKLSKTLGEEGLSLLVDHPDQLLAVEEISQISGNAPLIFLKIDMGYHRAGVIPHSEDAARLISAILAAEKSKSCLLYGIYAHAGQSYYGSSRATAIGYLRQELEALLVVTESINSIAGSRKLVLSVGATPTATSLRNLLVNGDGASSDEENKAISALKGTFSTIQAAGCTIEAHAGVYPVLDVQQLATHALRTEGPEPMLHWSHLGFTILAEVISLYPGRGENGGPEALISAGSLALGRETCKAYSGFGIVTPWNGANTQQIYGPESVEGWQIGRISQEHGILTWSGELSNTVGLKVGQKIRIWPNHSCIAGAGFDWYLVVDSDQKGRENEIIDVWPRWRGW